jgi:hypothetical protein
VTRIPSRHALLGITVRQDQGRVGIDDQQLDIGVAAGRPRASAGMCAGGTQTRQPVGILGGRSMTRQAVGVEAIRPNSSG